ncbi:MAG: hypothetical protein FWH26_09175 [Oscillospiraceae bacterium]|nr:hypothetical protein [Oscillospiraceae bacterium]
MVIRVTRATKFFCVCAFLLVSVMVSIGTRSITVSSPYAAGRTPLPLLLYRGLETGGPTALTVEDLRRDIAFLRENGYAAVSERELLAALRREAPLPDRPVLLLFDDTLASFAETVRPCLEQAGTAWFPLAKAGLLSKELRAAGMPVTRLERTAGIGMEDYLLERKK